MKNDLPITEELDFHYLLQLMPPLKEVPEFAWLPELFSIIGHERLINLCKYAGGEVIRVPTLEELASCVEALQWFYDVDIVHRKERQGVPFRLLPLFSKIEEIYSNAMSSDEHN